MRWCSKSETPPPSYYKPDDTTRRLLMWRTDDPQQCSCSQESEISQLEGFKATFGKLILRKEKHRLVFCNLLKPPAWQPSSLKKRSFYASLFQTRKTPIQLSLSVAEAHRNDSVQSLSLSLPINTAAASATNWKKKIFNIWVFSNFLLPYSSKRKRLLPPPSKTHVIFLKGFFSSFFNVLLSPLLLPLLICSYGEMAFGCCVTFDALKRLKMFS